MTSAASLSRSDAWNSPSALMIFARRSRSASACRAIARCISAGISTSFTSTTETLIPQGAVCSSMIPWRIELIFSRSESSSSSVCWPSTERRVVCAICDVATMKFSTWTIADLGSTIRKYATALTRAGTLSFVITSWGGMVSVIVRMSTLTIRSTIGTRKTTPGPFGSRRRPRRNTTPSWYSRRMRTKNMAVLSTFRGDGQFDPVQCVHGDVLAGAKLCSVADMRAPQLAVDEDEAAFAHLAVHADERLRTACHRPAPCGDPFARDECPEGGDCEAGADDESGVDAIRRRRVGEEQREPDTE